MQNNTTTNNESIVFNDRWIDAQRMHKNNPNTFNVPSRNDLTELQIGDSVKICNGHERFWVRLSVIYKAYRRQKSTAWIFIGRVDNILINEKPYKLGDLILFRGKNIYEITRMSDINNVIAKLIEEDPELYNNILNAKGNIEELKNLNEYTVNNKEN
jgi:hypothetical protein